jgi:thymidylate synthase
MKVIHARNVNDALVKGAQLLKEGGRHQDSRAGGTLEYPEPVCTVYGHPLERVLFDPVRDANPFFHLMEALWMLAGRNDVDWLVRFNQRMATYSDDGVVFNAAYGYRWREQFEVEAAHGEELRDQLSAIVRLLRADLHSRRAVLQIWDAEADLGVASKDIACNTQAMFKVRDGKLNITVSNRSNDVVWGCYGANAVQFSMLLEYLAARIGVEPGHYRQVSDSYHAYYETWPKICDIGHRFRGDPYACEEVSIYPLVGHPDSFDGELRRWFETTPEQLSLERWDREAEQAKWRNPYFIRVATPMHNSWFAYKRRDREAAQQWLDRCAATDWQRAGREWLQRRQMARDRAALVSAVAGH